MNDEVVICIGNKEFSLPEAFSFCNGGIFCTSSLVNDESSLLEYREFNSVEDFFNQLEGDANTSWRTSMDYYERDVYIKGRI